MFDEEFASNLRKARQDAGLTQAQLAEKIGVIKGCVSSYECGRTMPNLLRMRFISTVLCVPIDDIVPPASCSETIEADENQITVFNESGD